jgi:hypothetical protein
MSTFNAPETGRKNGCSAVQRGCHWKDNCWIWSRTGQSNEEDPLHLEERHFPMHVPAAQKKQNATRKCVVCAGEKNKKRIQISMWRVWCWFVCSTMPQDLPHRETLMNLQVHGEYNYYSESTIPSALFLFN